MARLLRDMKIRLEHGGGVGALSESALEITQLMATIGKDVGNALGCVPASLVAGTLVSVLATVQTVKTNKEESIRLALRAARFWVDLRDRMNGRWPDAPPELIADVKKLQRTLVSIHHVMQRAALHSWADRFMHKFQIGGDIVDHAKMLEDAIQSFHMSALIDLRLIAGPVPTQSPLVKERFLKTCPPPSVFFTGRLDILAQIHDFFAGKSNRQRIFLLWGLGGSGKTQLMYKFVQECQVDAEQSCFSDVFFIDSTTAQTIDEHLRNIAQTKKCGESAQDALTWLAGHHANWLMLFNNADDTSLVLRQYFPSCSHGNIIITSRNSGLRTLAPHSNCQVSSMNPNDAIHLLLEMAMHGFSDQAQKSAHSIAKELGYLALALVQAGAYIAKSSCSIATYHELYQRHHLDLLMEYEDEVQKIDGYEQSVYTTWSISFRQLSPLAVHFLQVCAFMHHEGITEAIFHHASQQRGLFKPIISESDKEMAMVNKFLAEFEDTNGNWEKRTFLKIIAEVSSYSLMDIDQHNQLFSIHPLLHAWSQTTIVDGEFSKQCTQYILRMSITWTKESKDYTFRRALLPHIDETLKSQQKLNCDIADGFALVYREGGRLKDAEKLDRLVMEKRKQVLGEEHPETLTSMKNLAETMLDQGKLKEAEELLLVVMEGQKWVLGKEHPHTLSTMGLLALSLCNQGRLKEAEDLQLVVVETSKLLIGEEHPDTLAAMNNLALIFKNQGQWKEAEELELVVMGARKRLLGEEHPATLKAMGNLAGTFWNQGRWKDAEKLELVVMEVRKCVLGEEHPETLRAMENLAGTFQSQGQWKESEALQLVVMEGRKRILGEEHPDTLRTMGNLASSLRYQGRLTEAEELELVTVDRRKQVMGDKHPDTLWTMGNLMLTFRDQGRLTESAELGLLVMEMRRQVLGNEHPHTLLSMDRLASTFWRQGQLKEAVELQLVLIDGRKQVLGEEHPQTLEAIANLALYQAVSVMT